MAEPRQSRIAFLRERVEAATEQGKPTFPVPFRQGQRDLVQIEVSIQFPLYNIKSGRTHRAQSDWIDRHELDASFFEDPEAEEVQQAQHQILLEMIDEEGLAQDLLDRKQRNPVVLTFDGYIVDGNRRIAALRSQGEVENVRAVVLPSEATISEVYETELELQMARETRAEYNWIDQALHVAYGVRTLGEPLRSVARRMNEPDREIEGILARLALVDLYLDWLGAEGKYHRIPADARSAAEQAFRELADREARQQFRALPEQQRRAIRLACFTAIANGGGYMDIRHIADTLRTKPAEVVARIRERVPAEVAEKFDEAPDVEERDASEGSADDLLEALASAEDAESAPLGGEILNIVSTPAEARDIAPVLIEVAEELVEEERESQQHLEPIRQVERALKLLQGITLTEETQRIDDFAKRLDELISYTEQLTEKLEALRSKQS